MSNYSLRRRFGNKRTMMTMIFLIIQIVLFLLMTIMGGSTNVFTLIRFGAKFNPAILAGEFWRLITPIFLHIGFTHILLNSVTLYFLGSQLEIIYGNLRFAIIYLMGGIMGNAMSFAFSDAVSAGASTSLFGLFAATIVLGRLYPHNYAIRDMAQGFTVLIILNFIAGLTSGSVDNWGHLGGAIGGALGAMVVPIPNMAVVEKSTRIKMLLVFILLLAIFIGFRFVYYGML